MHLNYLESKCTTVKTYKVKKVKEVKTGQKWGNLDAQSDAWSSSKTTGRKWGKYGIYLKLLGLDSWVH